MNRSSFVKSAVVLSILTSNISHAGTEGTSGTRTIVAEKTGTLLIEMPKEEGCELKVSTGPRSFERDLNARTSTGTELGDLMANQPRVITLSKYSETDPDKIDALQVEAAKKLGQQIASMILTKENLGNEESILKVHDMISSLVGQLPDGSFESLRSINEANVSELKSPNSSSSFQRNTENSLAELTRIVTEYRKKGLDVNTFANLSDKLSGLPGAGRFFKSTADILRTRFQSVQHAIKAINDTLIQGIGDMRLSVEQLKQARLDAVVMEKYLRLSLVTMDEIERIANEHAANITDQNALVLYQKNILTPIAQRKNTIDQKRASIALAYNTFCVLMDRFLNLIVLISNLRETTELDITTLAAATIKANQLDRMTNLANDLGAARDEMRNKLVAQLRTQGMKIREMPNKVLQSTQQLIGLFDQLAAEIELSNQSIPQALEVIGQSSKLLEQKLQSTNAAAGHQSYIKIADSLSQTALGKQIGLNQNRSIAEVEKVQTVTALLEYKPETSLTEQK